MAKIPVPGGGMKKPVSNKKSIHRIKGLPYVSNVPVKKGRIS